MMYLSAIILFMLMSGVISFNLTILHTNDVHAHYEEMNKYGGQCDNPGSCYGGMARLKYKVDEIKRLYPNTLFLDGGDQYQGTLWFTHHGGTIVHTYMNLVGYDAMAFGNHEFDRGISGLMTLLENSNNFTIVSCNIDTTSEPSVQNKFVKSVIMERGGEQIGIIGYTTKSTPFVSNPGNLIFLDEVTSIRTQVAILQNQGVNKIIAVGHAGFKVDQKIATEVDDVDIVVGGHTNTFLYTGTAPSNEKPVNVYPTVVTKNNGDKALVVQDYAFAKYLGFLQVEFDNDGKIISYGGNPILLDSTVPKDEAIQNITNEFGKEVLSMMNNVIGRTLVYLNGDRHTCRLQECNMGNLIADSLVHQNLLHADSIAGTHVFISLVNSGSIRSSMDRGNITVGHALQAQPFRNTLETIKLRGDYLLQALEHSVSDYDVEEPSGKFLQYSGIKVKYDLAKPPQHRVVEASAVCQNCTFPAYEPIDKTVMYSLILSNFILTGGDSYHVIRDNAELSHTVGDLDSDVLIEYVKNASPFYHGIEGRIMIVNSTETTDSLTCDNGAIVTCDKVKCPQPCDSTNRAISTNTILSFNVLCLYCILHYCLKSCFHI
ncbi:5'-nucleotidase [Mytilus galloprovincialis]|uniref:5'-nucleotidase n=1 Tax=Mytilus galloprovincialis TaxID=29158 RepID=A0A8B6DWU5_MYTGA|nr:5'-nucleotidase [Mytilus galloprovincialis]